MDTKRKSIIDDYYTMNEYVEMRLKIWHEWFSWIKDDGLGYPRCSVEAKLAETGGIFIKNRNQYVLPTNRLAEEIEELVCKLYQQTPRIATALRTYYFERGPARIKANKLGVSRAQYNIDVDLAKQWIAGNLTALGYYKEKNILSSKVM